LEINIEKLKAEVGEKLRLAREEANMSQEELAGMIGLSKVGYGALERGKNLIGLQYLIMLTYILKKPIIAFLPDYVTGAIHNSPMLDPRFQELASFWPQLQQQENDCDHILHFARRLAASPLGSKRKRET